MIFWGLGEVVGVFGDGFIVFRGDLEVCWCVFKQSHKKVRLLCAGWWAAGLWSDNVNGRAVCFQCTPQLYISLHLVHSSTEVMWWQQKNKLQNKRHHEIIFVFVIKFDCLGYENTTSINWLRRGAIKVEIKNIRSRKWIHMGGGCGHEWESVCSCLCVCG